jgi:hypothetical protein
MKMFFIILLISTLTQLTKLQFIKIHGYIKLYELRVEPQNKNKLLDYILDGLHLFFTY